MKNLLIILSILLANVGWINAVNSSDEALIEESISSVPSNFVGDYYGLLYDIEMNGQTGYDDQNMTFTVTSNGKLKGTLPQIGNMPGTITIDMPISVESDGTMTTDAGSDQVGTLTIVGFIPVPLYLDGTNSTAFSNASIDPNTKEMNFTLKVKGSYLGIKYPASVSFTSFVFTPL